jgi:hypothetical protein
MRKVISILIAWISIHSLCYSQSYLSFDEEDITFEIRDSTFIVEGLYYFNSGTPKQYPILYPFPTDSIFGTPSDVTVTYINTGKSIPFTMKKNASAIVFSASIQGKTPIMISYRQRLKANKARYILLTTHYWDNPLKQVNYKLITQPDFTVKRFWERPDKEIELDNKKMYLWQKVNFMPAHDFEIEF